MKYSVIPRVQLIKDRWYLGRGRTSSVARWDGEDFQTIGYESDLAVLKTEGYYEETSGCFQPFCLIDEGKMVEPFGRVGWDAHYGRTLKVRGGK